uniref:Uncharacterized protein n=1 Tax=Micrurus lemniscatus lemniscatus TaxID=129467 RepID=A0A2D4HYT2_MICLE
MLWPYLVKRFDEQRSLSILFLHNTNQKSTEDEQRVWRNKGMPDRVLQQGFHSVTEKNSGRLFQPASVLKCWTTTSIFSKHGEDHNVCCLELECLTLQLADFKSQHSPAS